MGYWIAKIILAPLLRLVFRPWIDGAENVPQHGPAILASNHLSFSDSIFLPIMLPRKVTFLAKDEYFTGTDVKGRLRAMFMRGVGQIPLDRRGGKASEAAVRTALRVLSRGELMGIYPEGTRSPDGRLYRGRTGVARMALSARVPVIPVAMVDTDRVQPTGKVIPNLVRPGMRIGKPLDFSRYEGLEDDRWVTRSVTDEIMYELMQLSGQEYVDMYASKAKEQLARARAEARAARVAAVRGAIVRRVPGASGGGHAGAAEEPEPSAGSASAVPAHDDDEDDEDVLDAPDPAPGGGRLADAG